MQKASMEDALILDDLLTGALTQLYPPGSELAALPIRDRIGALIIMKMVRHLAGNDIPPNAQLMMAITWARIGASTGFTPTRSSVDMLTRLN
jgi:hypothetical protein